MVLSVDNPGETRFHFVANRPETLVSFFVVEL